MGYLSGANFFIGWEYLIWKIISKRIAKKENTWLICVLPATCCGLAHQAAKHYTDICWFPTLTHKGMGERIRKKTKNVKTHGLRQRRFKRTAKEGKMIIIMLSLYIRIYTIYIRLYCTWSTVSGVPVSFCTLAREHWLILLLVFFFFSCLFGWFCCLLLF